MKNLFVYSRLTKLIRCSRAESVRLGNVKAASSLKAVRTAFAQWALAVGLVAIPPALQAQMSFAFQHAADLDSRALAGFEQAAMRWSTVLADPITISLNVRFDLLTEDGGGTDPTLLKVSYRDFQQALLADRTSALDDRAASGIASVNSINLVINRTSDSPADAGSSVPYLDANNSLNNQTVALSLANARALGLYAPQGGETDASIVLNSRFNWDFDPSDGISSGAVDFVGAATHEIGHALGFLSGTQVLDYAALSGPAAVAEDDLAYVSSLDLFRYSAQSRAYGKGVIDWTADTREKYFSVDGGDSSLAYFSTGEFFGDGQEASHWKKGLGLGAMDPTIRSGELVLITGTDIDAFDAIGYDRKSSPVPDSSVTGIAGLTLLLMALVERRRAIG